MKNEKQIDEEVYSYVVRAYKMLNNQIFEKNNFPIATTIEIAKMIQKEEFRNNGVYFKD